MDLYVILGIERGATLADIKRAYKRLARKFHPDINPGDRMAAAQFRQIAEAYETLSDPDRRHRYDTSGACGRCGREADLRLRGVRLLGQRPRHGGADLRRSVRGRASSATRSAATGRPSAAPICTRRSRSTFDDALAGGQRVITVTRQEHCATCARLGPAARRRDAVPALPGHRRGASRRAATWCSRSRAPYCGGTGRHAQMRCPACGGQQVAMRAESMTVHVPPGAGGRRAHPRCRARDTPAGTAARHGDLFITVRVKPHPLFRRDGDDLLVTVPIAIHEAALGARIEVPSIDGPARLRVPPGTQSGQRFRLRERGVRLGARRAARRSGGRGAAGAAAGCSTSARRSCCGSSARINSDDVRRVARASGEPSSWP